MASEHLHDKGKIIGPIRGIQNLNNFSMERSDHNIIMVLHFTQPSKIMTTFTVHPLQIKLLAEKSTLIQNADMPTLKIITKRNSRLPQYKPRIELVKTNISGYPATFPVEFYNRSEYLLAGEEELSQNPASLTYGLTLKKRL
jgi:hypothetical protein